MTTNSYPSLEEFLNAPTEEVTKVAPATLIFAGGGTRRSAVLAGISPISDDYIKWIRKKTIESFKVIFENGVRHIIASAMVPTTYNEVTQGYHIIKWANWALSGPEALADYIRLGWRVRLLGAESLPEFKNTVKKFNNMTWPENSPTVWFTVVSNNDLPWEELFRAIQKKQVCTRREAIRELYKEDIPLATLLLSFGKPEVFPAIVPPLLMGKLQCYWKQQPGCNLDEQTFRTILYDYAYLRKTWLIDKSGRAEKVLKYRTTWEQGATIGLGMRLGPFWYPAPILPPYEEDV